MRPYDWVGRTKRKKVFVTGTVKRPVPLEHVLYFGGDRVEDFYKIGEHEKFLPGGYKAGGFLRSSARPTSNRLLLLLLLLLLRILRASL